MLHYRETHKSVATCMFCNFTRRVYVVFAYLFEGSKDCAKGTQPIRVLEYDF